MWHVSRRSCYHYVNCIEKASFIISFDYICVITFCTPESYAIRHAEGFLDRNPA